MRKIDYIKEKLKNLDRKVLMSKKTIPGTTSEVTFLEYCAKYVPNMMDENFKLTGDEFSLEGDDFITTLDDLIFYQIYKVEKEKIIKEEKQEEKQVEEKQEEEKKNTIIIENEEPTSNLLNEVGFKVQTPDHLNEKQRRLVDNMKKKYSSSLDYVVHILKNNETLGEYIERASHSMDAIYNVNIMGFILPFEEEIREQAETAKTSYEYVEKVYKELSERGVKRVDSAYVRGYILSVHPKFDENNLYYKLAIDSVKKSLDRLTKESDKDAFFKAITVVNIPNKKLASEIEAYYQYSKSTDMSKLMNELTGRKEENDYPRYVIEAIERINNCKYKYAKLENKTVESLSSLINELTTALIDLEEKLGDKKSDSLEEIYKDGVRFRNYVKLDEDFICHIKNIRTRFNRIKRVFDENPRLEADTYLIAFNDLKEKLEKAWLFVEGKDIIRKEDEILREEIASVISYLKTGDLQVASGRRI